VRPLARIHVIHRAEKGRRRGRRRRRRGRRRTKDTQEEEGRNGGGGGVNRIEASGRGKLEEKEEGKK
jgi:hypothetical protein